MESTKITENLRQVKLKNQEIELFKQGFVIVPYKVSGFLDYTNRGLANEAVNPNDFETFKRIWTGNDSCTITWKDSFKLVQNSTTKEMEQKWSLGEVFIGTLETNEFFNDIATDTSFSEYKSQQQINSLKFRVHKYFKISDYYNFMFFKIPEISGSTLYRIDNIEKDFAGTELLNYVITFKTINQELANTGRAKQQNIMPSAPGQGYLECVVKDKNWPNELGKEVFNKLVPGQDYYAFYDRYITADFQKTLNNPVKKVVVKALGNGIINSFSMTGRPASYNSMEFKASRKLFCINFSSPTTPNIYRSQSSVQNFYASNFGMTLQYYKEFFTYLKDTMSSINKFNYQGWITYLDNIKGTNTGEGLYSDWNFTLGEQTFTNLYTYGVSDTYKTKTTRNVDNFFFDNYWTTKNVKIAPLNTYSTLNYGTTGFGAGLLALAGALRFDWGGFLAGSLLSVVGLYQLSKQKQQQSTFKGISGITPKDIIDFNEGLYNSQNKVPFNLYDNSTPSDTASEVFFKSNTINMSFEADITDSFISDRVSNKTMNTANIGQTQFENGDYILPDQSTFLLNGDATLQATKENGFIIDNFQFCGIFNGDISVEFLDSRGDTVWSGVYQSEAKWTKNQREIWTEKNVSIYGREDIYISEPVPYPKPLTPTWIDTQPETMSLSELIGGKSYQNDTGNEFKISQLDWVKQDKWTTPAFLGVDAHWRYCFYEFSNTPQRFTINTNQTLNDLKQTYSIIKFSIYQVFKTTKFHMTSSREFPHPQYITPSNCYEEYELWNQRFNINEIPLERECVFNLNVQNFSQKLKQQSLFDFLNYEIWSTLPYSNLTFTFKQTNDQDPLKIFIQGVLTQLNQDITVAPRTLTLYGSYYFVGPNHVPNEAVIDNGGELDTRIYFKVEFEE